MKLASWNVNGLRACVGKGFLEALAELDVDFLCLQETKMQEGQLALDPPGYSIVWNSAEKKGYSGTAIFARQEPLRVIRGFSEEEHNREGRVLTLEYTSFYLVTAYSPNAQEGLKRLEYRLSWEEAFRRHLTALDGEKPVVVCGDLNVAHREIDLKNPGPNRGNAGFSDQEREAFSTLLAAGFTDTYRLLHPEETGAYSWWSYRFHAREKNAGWRIDYFLVSDRLAPAVQAAAIRPDIYGSDHCPVTLTLELS